MGISLSFTLVARGSAILTIEVDRTSITLYPSYLADSFEHLLIATVDAVEGRTGRPVLVIEEPGTSYLFLSPEGDAVDIRITTWSEAFAREINPGGETAFAARCRLRTFAGAVLSAAQGLLSAHGENGYRNQWGHAFPTARMGELEATLRNTKRLRQEA